MARFNATESEHYGSSGGAGFFQLKADKEVARVRFMYSGIDDVEGFSVHRVEVDGKDRYVNCLRNYNDPVDVCPFCREKKFTQAKLFVPIYDVDTGETKIWDRGKQFFGKISSVCSRYPNTVSHIFEIERNGKPHDTSTTYEIYEVDRDETTLDDLPERQQVLGSLVLDKTAEDMEYYLQEGQFPPTEDEEPVRRRTERHEEERPVRRTPASRRERF